MPNIGMRARTCAKVTLALATTVLMSCATPNLQISVDSAADINQASDQQAYAVLVRVYHLSDASVFNAASYESLWKNNNDALNASVLKRTEFMIEPDSSLALSLPKLKHSTAYGVVAFYRDYSEKNWKLTTPVKNSIVKRTEQLDIALTDLGLSIKP